MSSGGLGMKIRAGGAFVTLGVNDKLSIGLSMAERKLQAFGQRVAAMGTKLATASIAMLGPAAASQKVFANFETSMMKVKAIITPTAQEFTAMWQQAKKLGAETQFTASDAARAMATFAQANFTTQQIMSAMPATLDLAAAGEMDVAEAADIAATIMNAMGIKAEDLVTTVDVLTKASQTASTDLRQLGHAFQYAGAIAATAGLSLEEAVVFLQMMSNASIKADMAGTTLRGALLALSSPSQMAKERLNELGIDVSTISGDFASLSEIIKQFNKQMGHLGSQEQMAFLGDIFDSRQAAGFAKAVANGHELFVKMEKSLYNSTGAAQKFAKTMMSGVTGSWLYLTSAIEGLQIALGEINSNLTQGILGGLTDIVGRAMKWAEANKSAVQSMIVMAGVIGAAGVALLGFSILIQGVMIALTPVSIAIGLVTGAISTLTSAAAFLMTPFGMLVAATAIVVTSFNNFGAELNNIAVMAYDWSRYMVSVFQYTGAGMADALSAGNMELAWKIAMAGLKLSTVTTLDELGMIFNTSIGGMIDGIQSLYKSIGTAVMYWREFANFNKDWMSTIMFAFYPPSWNSEAVTPEIRASRATLDAAWASLDAMNPTTAGQAVDNLMVDTAKKSYEELVALREEAKTQSQIAEENRNKLPTLGPPREMPAPRVPDMPNMPKIEEAKKEIDRAIAFAAVGSLGGRLLDRMGAGPKSVTDKIAENTKKMLQEQQETNQILGDMDGLTFAP